MTYEDDTASITITKESYAGSICYVAHLQITDYTRLETGSANGSFGGGYETTSDAAERLGAIFAVNGDYSPSDVTYAVAQAGVVCHDAACNVAAVYNSNDGILTSPSALGVEGVQLSTLVDEGLVTDTFYFVPAGLVDGENVASTDTTRAQRTFIGTDGTPGDIWIVVSEGRYVDGSSAGLTYQECMDVLLYHGCTFGANLDGGGSSTMYFDGQVLNSAAANQRAVVNYLYLLDD